jgi:hypothetical protein
MISVPASMPHFENSPVKKIILVPAKSQNFSNSP